MSSSLFITSLGTGGGGGGGTPTTVIDSLLSQSPTAALSANQGYVLDQNAKAHADKKASDTELGHVMVDGSTIIIDANGKISAVGGGITPSGRFYQQAVLETTIVDQTTWKLPFTDFNYPQDLLIVSQNSTFLNTDMFTVTQTGNDWFVNIPNDSTYPLPIANNTVFAIAIKGFGGGTTSIVQKSYEEKLITSTVGQKKWEITTSNFDPVNDTVFPVYNTTLLTEDMYTITQETGKYFITINDVPSNQPIVNNSLSLKVMYNTVSTGMNDISGQLLIDNSVPEKKLMPNLRDKINLRIITFEEQGDIKVGDANAHRAMPFECHIDSFDVSVLVASAQDLSLNILVTDDFVTWSKITPTDIIIPANSHVTTFTPASQVQIEKGKHVRLTIVSTYGDAKSLAVNMNVKTI